MPHACESGHSAAVSLGTARLRCASCVGSSPHQHGLLVDFIHQRDHAHGGARIRAVAQPCIHAGRVERGAAEREDEREHPSAFAEETDARMRTPLARQGYECACARGVLEYRRDDVRWICPHPASGCNSCELSDVSSTRQTTATLTCTANRWPAGARALRRLRRAVTAPPPVLQPPPIADRHPLLSCPAYAADERVARSGVCYSPWRLTSSA